MKVLTYDKIKNYFMPYDSRKYSGFDFFWRASASAVFTSGLTMLFTYPFDVFHTKMTADMSKKGEKRLFTTTFDCFNKTHLDGGRAGLFKGF